MLNLFSVNNTLFTLLNCSVSYIEFIGIIFTFMAAILIARANIWSWLLSIIGVCLYTFIFFQFKLYPDVVIQIMFLIANCYGWYKWSQDPVILKNGNIITYSASIKERIIFAIAIVIGILVVGFIINDLNHMAPSLSDHPVSLPYADSSIAVIGLAATIWQIRKCANAFILWIINDAIIVVIYLIKNTPFVSLSYFVLLIIAVRGLFNWLKLRKRYPVNNNKSIEI